jgi:hypothetical protein
VREVDLNEPPTDREWGTVLLMCGNLGLGGTREGNRRLLTRLADVTGPGARLIGDSVDYDGRLGVSLRLRYRDQVTPWWRQYNVPTAQIPQLVAGTGWEVERHVQGGVNHAVVLRRTESP